MDDNLTPIELTPVEPRPEAPVPPPQPSLGHRIFLGPHGLRAGWRLIIYIAILAGLIFATNNIIKAIMHATGHHGARLDPLGPLGLNISRWSGVLLLLLAAWIMAKIEKRPVGNYGLPIRFAFGAQFWEGAVWGFGALTIMLLAMRVTGDFHFGAPSIHGLEILKWGGAWALAFLGVGFVEEMLFRGYPMITTGSGITFWPAMVVWSLVFLWAHTGNPGETWIGLVAVAEFGVFLGYSLWRTGMLWFAVGLHMGWDWGESFFYGVPDSGMKSPHHFLEPTISNAKWITGGTVGPEGSVYVPILLTLMLIAVHLRFRQRAYEGTAYGLKGFSGSQR
jgi:CAAX protease family protein